MSTNTTSDTVALRDQAGTWYVLTPDILAEARATTAQQAQLEQQAGDDTTGFSIIVHDLVASPLALKPPSGQYDAVQPVEPPSY